jgi:nucleoside-diphosphate-sugar epimerase
MQIFVAGATGVVGRRLLPLLIRLLVGEPGVAAMTIARGLSNAKAKRELRWQPQWPTWREGFRRGLGE